MNDSFRITALPREIFAPLFDRSSDELAAKGMRRLVADKKPYYPCRVSLVDAEPGESVLMLSHLHLPVDSPYRSSGPIFVREQASMATPAVGELPEMLRHRLLAVRAYDRDSKMVAAEVIDGPEVKSQIERFLADSAVDYLHLHNARIGCFFCRVDRA